MQASQFIATLSKTLFCGAAIYINVTNIPRAPISTIEAPQLNGTASYKRATWM